MELTNIVAENITNAVTNMDQVQIIPIPSSTTTWAQVAMYIALALVPCVPSLMTYLKQVAMGKVQALNTERIEKTATNSEIAKDKLSDVHDKVNGKMDALIASKVAEALAQGVLAGTSAEKARGVKESSDIAKGVIIGAASSFQTPVQLVQPIIHPELPTITKLSNDCDQCKGKGFTSLTGVICSKCNGSGKI